MRHRLTNTRSSSPVRLLTKTPSLVDLCLIDFAVLSALLDALIFHDKDLLSSVANLEISFLTGPLSF